MTGRTTEEAQALWRKRRRARHIASLLLGAFIVTMLSLKSAGDHPVLREFLTEHFALVLFAAVAIGAAGWAWASQRSLLSCPYCESHLWIGSKPIFCEHCGGALES
jgi:hypothetical protein